MTCRVRSARAGGRKPKMEGAGESDGIRRLKKVTWRDLVHRLTTVNGQHPVKIFRTYLLTVVDR